MACSLTREYKENTFLSNKFNEIFEVESNKDGITHHLVNGEVVPINPVHKEMRKAHSEGLKEKIRGRKEV